MKAWADVFSHLNDRSRKPRTAGVTMIIDKCQGLTNMADLLALTGDYVDHWKLSFGTSALLDDDVLRQKITLARDNDLLVYPGGTLTEYAVLKGVYPEFVRRTCELGFSGLEISDGTIHIPPDVRRELIGLALEAGLTVVSEVGKKDPREQPSAAKLAEQALLDFQKENNVVFLEEQGNSAGRYLVSLNSQMATLKTEAQLLKLLNGFFILPGAKIALGQFVPCLPPPASHQPVIINSQIVFTAFLVKISARKPIEKRDVRR